MGKRPTGPLARWVECAWSLESGSAIAGHRVPPDGCLDIIYDRRSGLRAIGAMTAEQRFDFPDGAHIAGIRFRPGMAGPFLGISPAQLTDESAALDELWPHQARELAGRLDDASSIREVMRVLPGSLPVPVDGPNPGAAGHRSDCSSQRQR